MDEQSDRKYTQEIVPEKTYNTRFPRMWSYLKKHITLGPRTFLDLGCGRGDMVWKMHLSAFAGTSIGIDKEPPFDLYPRLNIPHLNEFNTRQIWFIKSDINTFINEPPIFPEFDYVSCFSVLPYLKDATAVLRWMYRNARVSLIECQYAKDGPGFEHIKNNDDMEKWLKSIGWKKPLTIGHTKIRDRNAKRYIWYCAKDSDNSSRG